MLVPRRDVPDFPSLSESERAELAVMYPRLLRQVDKFFPGIEKTAYIAGWNQAPVHEGREFGRLHLQLFSLRRSPDKMKYLAGSESAMGVWINDTTPERIAERLREVAEK
jgi:UDPglucose--hexose-1-phosphate uridylyltransferase